jgi:hypothetical protein
LSNDQPIQWPTLKVGGETKTLRFSHSASFQLAKWGFSTQYTDSLKIPFIALAAAMMGEFDGSGKWRSTGWERPVDLADVMQAEEIPPMVEAVREAMVKAGLWMIKAPTTTAILEQTPDAGPAN